MITGTDQLTADQRARATDCLIEMALLWLQRPLALMTETERGQAIRQVCLLIAQMRHREPSVMDTVRRRWIDQVTVRLITQCPLLRGHETGVQFELEKQVSLALYEFHDWREAHAPVVERAKTGPSEGGDVVA